MQIGVRGELVSCHGESHRHGEGVAQVLSQQQLLALSLHPPLQPLHIVLEGVVWVVCPLCTDVEPSTGGGGEVGRTCAIVYYILSWSVVLNPLLYLCVENTLLAQEQRIEFRLID